MAQKIGRRGIYPPPVPASSSPVLKLNITYTYTILFQLDTVLPFVHDYTACQACELSLNKLLLTELLFHCKLMCRSSRGVTCRFQMSFSILRPPC